MVRRAKSTMSSASTPKRRGRPPGSKNKAKLAGVAGSVKRGPGRPPSAVKKMAKKVAPLSARNLRADMRAQITEAKAESKAARDELKLAQKREKVLMKILEGQEAAIGKYIQKWQSDELRKLARVAKPKKRRSKRM